MASNPNTCRAMVKGSAFAFIFVSVLAFASPAQAGTVTLSCEGEVGADGTSSTRNWTVDIDYTAQTMKWEVPGLLNSFEYPAVITEREITFSYRSSNAAVEGRMDRLAGTMNATRQMFVSRERLYFQGRCRPAATPKW